MVSPAISPVTVGRKEEERQAARAEKTGASQKVAKRKAAKAKEEKRRAEKAAKKRGKARKCV